MIFRWAAILASVAFITGCGDEKLNKLADAQACMNDSTPETVNSCMSKLDGVDSPRANLMKCSIKLMAEGIGESEVVVDIAEAFDGSSVGNPAVAAMSFLAFTSDPDTDVNLANAEEAKDYCLKTEAEGFITLASFAFIATNLAKIGDFKNGAKISPGELADLLDDPDSDTQAVIGETALATYESSCTQGSKEGFCAELESAIKDAGPNPNSRQIGAALLNGMR